MHQMESIFIHSLDEGTVDEFLLRGDQNAMVSREHCSDYNT
jgi:hypothetical protein